MLFDPDNPASEEGAIYYRLKEIIGGLANFATLIDREQAVAPSYIYIGPMDDPWDEEAKTVGELQEAFGWCQLLPVEEDSMRVFQSKGVGMPPNKSGSILCGFQRQVRDAEFNDPGGRQDSYLSFLDLTSGIAQDVITVLKDEWWYEQMRRQRGPHYNAKPKVPSQGRFLWTDFVIDWATESQQ